jgi:beta-glucosidase
MTLMAQTPFASAALPTTFRFCMATSAHQVEGHNVNSDWWQWEHTPGKIKNGDTSEFATDSWNHVDEDIKNLKWLGVDSYRFSIEWAKIEPHQGEWNDDALKQYVDFIDKLNANSIEPMVTLYHFTLPQWVAEEGGLDWVEFPTFFNRYVEHVAKVMGTRVKLWITLNEPMSVMAGGYISNIFPPAKNDFGSISFPMENMVRAHALAYHTLHNVLDTKTFQVKVGIAHHLRPSVPDRPHNLLDRFATSKYDQIFNWAIPDALVTGKMKFNFPFLIHANADIPEAIGTQDFFGLNYYSRDRVHVDLLGKEKLIRKTTEGSELTDLGWEVYPDGLLELLTEVHSRYSDLPIWITENGIADSTDTKRTAYLQAHFRRIDQAIQNGIPVEGYCHWTLNDNFEWAEGYEAKFGLFSLEPGTLKRLPRQSAFDFKEFVRLVKAGQNPYPFVGPTE